MGRALKAALMTSILGVPAPAVAPAAQPAVQSAPSTSARPHAASTSTASSQQMTERLRRRPPAHGAVTTGCPWPGRPIAWMRRGGRAGDWR